MDSSRIDTAKAVVLAFNRDHQIGTHVQFWPGIRQGRGRFGRTRTPAELIEAYGTPVVFVEGHPGYIALTHVEPVPQQPDGIDEYDDGAMPEPAAAADRIDAYVREFGDGLYDVVNGAPLYGRDLVAVTRAARTPAREIAETMPTVGQWPGSEGGADRD